MSILHCFAALLSTFLAASAGAQALEITAQGVGPLNANVPFKQKTIQSLLPTLTVKKSTASSEGEERTVFEVLNGKTKLLSIDANGDKIGIINISNNAVRNTVGVAIGESYTQAYGTAKANCQAGMEEESGTVFCASRAPNVYHQFVGQWNGNDGVVPPVKVLANWTVKKIIWQAPTH